MQERQVQSLDQEDSLEKGMAAHTSILAWEISWTEEPGGLQSCRRREWGMTEVTEHGPIHTGTKKCRSQLKGNRSLAPILKIDLGGN